MGEGSASETSFWQDAVTLLLSEMALWVYSWLMLVMAMGVLAVFVMRMTRIARDLRPQDFLLHIEGKKPSRQSQIRRRIERLQAFEKNRVAFTSGLLAQILLTGAILPGGLLVIIAVWQDWFLPGSAVLLIDGTPFVPSGTGFRELGLFIVDQALRGALADALEVFRLALARIENNPDNLVYSGLVVLYRLVAGGAMLTVLYTLGRIALGMQHARGAISALQKQLD